MTQQLPDHFGTRDDQVADVELVDRIGLPLALLYPLGESLGARQSLQLMVQPRDATLVPQAKDEARVALRVERRLNTAAPANLGMRIPIFKAITASCRPKSISQSRPC